jgi:hypothetical protein
MSLPNAVAMRGGGGNERCFNLPRVSDTRGDIWEEAGKLKELAAVSTDF